MSDSILTSVKKLIGIVEEETTFDTDIIMHINSVFMILYQLGIGPTNGYSISDKTPTWTNYISPSANIEGLKSYMVLRVKSMFDPSSTSFTQDSFDKIIKELEYRLVTQKEFGQPPAP